MRNLKGHLEHLAWEDRMMSEDDDGSPVCPYLSLTSSPMPSPKWTWPPIAYQYTCHFFMDVLYPFGTQRLHIHVSETVYLKKERGKKREWSIVRRLNSGAREFLLFFFFPPLSLSLATRDLVLQLPNFTIKIIVLPTVQASLKFKLIGRYGCLGGSAG